MFLVRLPLSGLGLFLRLRSVSSLFLPPLVGGEVSEALCLGTKFRGAQNIANQGK